MYKKIASASHQFRKRTFTRRNTSINHRNIVVEPKKVSQLVLSPHHPHGSLTPRQKSLFLHSRIMVQHVCNTQNSSKLERLIEKKWRPSCSRGGRKIRMKEIWNNKAKKEERERGKRKKKGRRKLEKELKRHSASNHRADWLAARDRPDPGQIN